MELNAYQQELAADGRVSSAELAAAFEHAAECARAEGWQVTVQDSSDGGFTLAASAPKEDAERVMAKVDTCQDQWVGPLDQVFQASNLPQGAEREAEFAAWQECMRSNGAETEGVVLGMEQPQTIAQLESLNGPYPEWQISWADCVDKYYFVLWPDAAGNAD
ncbi:hypothetical protein [Demequina sp.]|uniref:hypothetical protein n=1 Tax=Demequina sp. TaxID=2050685 RepID=UPI003D10FFC9